VEFQGSDGQILLFLREVHRNIIVGGRGSTVHVSPCLTVTVYIFQNRTGLLSALHKS
jgi:hypothetical protein